MLRGPRRYVPANHLIWSAIGAAVILLGVACGAAATSAPPLPASTAAPSTVSEDNPAPGSPQTDTPEQPANSDGDVSAIAVPMLDTSIANVPLDDIVFDTFGRTFARYVPLDRASEELILNLRDAIMPIYQPAYGTGDDLPWLSDDDLVIGYVSGDDAFAYAVNILNLHELVNDEIGGIPVLISYCPLCVSGVTYHRQLDGRVLLFGNTSALYQSDLVMFDHQTGSYWFQTGGEAVVGPLTGSHLELLPSTTMAWGEWKSLYPETRVLTGTASSPTRFASTRYGSGFGGGYKERVDEGEFIFPVDSEKLDSRLLSGDLVLTIEVGDAVTAYPLDRIGDTAVNDEVGGLPVVVFNKGKGQAVGAFSRDTGGRTLSFEYQEDEGRFVDVETGSRWNAGGRAVEGPLAGTQLEHVNTRRAFWFSIAISFPGVNLYLPG